MPTVQIPAYDFRCVCGKHWITQWFVGIEKCSCKREIMFSRDNRHILIGNNRGQDWRPDKILEAKNWIIPLE